MYYCLNKACILILYYYYLNWLVRGLDKCLLFCADPVFRVVREITKYAVICEINNMLNENLGLWYSDRQLVLLTPQLTLLFLLFRYVVGSLPHAKYPHFVSNQI